MIVRDGTPNFLATLGIDMPAASGKSDRENTSLGQAQLDVLRELNSRIPAFIEGERNPIRAGLPEFIAAKSTFDPVYLDQANLDLLRARLQASNDRLMENFIDDPDFLIPNVATVPVDPTPAPDREEIMLQLFVNLWQEHKAQLDQQQHTGRNVFTKALRAAKKRGRRLMN